jgi:hypothetical protein
MARRINLSQENRRDAETIPRLTNTAGQMPANLIARARGAVTNCDPERSAGEPEARTAFTCQTKPAPRTTFSSPTNPPLRTAFAVVRSAGS